MIRLFSFCSHGSLQDFVEVFQFTPAIYWLTVLRCCSKLESGCQGNILVMN